MNWIALDMLFGNRTKFLGVVFGIAFSSLLITQQGAIFCGAMMRTTSQIRDIRGADVWVMNSHVKFLDDVRPLSDNDLYRVRGVERVDWAVPLFKGLGRIHMADGNFQQVVLIGLDDTTMVGAPTELLAGSLGDLRKPDAVLMDEAGYRFLWPDQPLAAGKEFELNDRRAVLVGICKASSTFILSNPIVYTRYSLALDYTPPQRRMMTFVLAQGRPGLAPKDICRRIEGATGLQALTRSEFEWKTMIYYLWRTGVAINFGTTILLGFFIGIAIAGQTFYTFTVENLRQFGTLKAMGFGNLRLTWMILLQAAIVSSIGYGLGAGVAALFGELAKTNSKLAFFLPWQVLVVSGVGVVLIGLFSSLLSIWRVLVLEPAIVFRG